jgi:hypothetical protein
MRAFLKDGAALAALVLLVLALTSWADILSQIWS